MSIATKTTQKKAPSSGAVFKKQANAKIPTKQNSPAQEILNLHQTIGNQGVQRLFESGFIQGKLTVGEPNDKYEQEADRVADEVMRMPEPKVQRQSGEEEKEEMVRTKPVGEQITPLVQREVEPEEEKEEEQIQTKAEGATPQITPNLESRINALHGGGQPLSKETRGFFEPRFGRDFSRVRIHNDSNAHHLARSINAQAFTKGSNIVFGGGEYSPESSSGKRLLGHELTHVVQQKSMNNQVYRQTFLLESLEQISKKKKVYPPVYWSIDHINKKTYAIARKGVTLDEVAQYLYGDNSFKNKLATLNNINPKIPLSSERKLSLIKGTNLTKKAFKNLNVSVKIPLGIYNTEAFMRKKKQLDSVLEKDFDFIVQKLNETYYSDSDEGEVISILKKWGEEKFTTRLDLYPNGGEYLDKLFSKLTRKRKDVGIVTTQWTNYYSLILNHFDRVNEVIAIRDKYSRRYKGDRGLKEINFGSFFAEQVAEGKIRDQIFAFSIGLGKGLWSGAKGTVSMIHTLITDPKKFWNGLKQMPAALKTLWQKRGELWKKFVNATPEEQAEMIGKVTGELEFMIASSAAGGAAAKGVEKLATAPGKIGKLASITQKAIALPGKALGAAAKGIKTIVFMGVKGAIEGAMFAAKGIYKVGKKILYGTWSVAKKTVGKVQKKFYYFYEKASGKIKQISEKVAKKFVKCSHCKLKKLDITDSDIDLILKNIEERNIKSGAIIELMPWVARPKLTRVILKKLKELKMKLTKMMKAKKRRKLLKKKEFLENFLASKPEAAHGASRKAMEKLSSHDASGKAMEKLSSYNAKDALTRLLPRKIHRSMDRYWMKIARDLVKQGRKDWTVQEMFEATVESIKKARGLSEAEKFSHIQRLIDEIFIENALKPGDRLKLPFSK